MDASTLAQSVGLSFEERCWDHQAAGARQAAPMLHGLCSVLMPADARGWEQLLGGMPHACRARWTVNHAATCPCDCPAEALEEQQNETNPGRSDAEVGGTKGGGFGGGGVGQLCRRSCLGVP